MANEFVMMSHHLRCPARAQGQDGPLRASRPDPVAAFARARFCGCAREAARVSGPEVGRRLENADSAAWLVSKGGARPYRRAHRGFDGRGERWWRRTVAGRERRRAGGEIIRCMKVSFSPSGLPVRPFAGRDRLRNADPKTATHRSQACTGPEDQQCPVWRSMAGSRSGPGPSLSQGTRTRTRKIRGHSSAPSRPDSDLHFMFLRLQRPPPPAGKSVAAHAARWWWPGTPTPLRCHRRSSRRSEGGPSRVRRPLGASGFGDFSYCLLRPSAHTTNPAPPCPGYSVAPAAVSRAAISVWPLAVAPERTDAPACRVTIGDSAGGRGIAMKKNGWGEELNTNLRRAWKTLFLALTSARAAMSRSTTSARPFKDAMRRGVVSVACVGTNRTENWAKSDPKIDNN